MMKTHYDLMDFDRKILERAKNMFDNRLYDGETLEHVIEKNIFPNVVIIEILNGKYGMGFFAHPEWLVSNAHVISSIDDIHTGICLKMYSNNYNNSDNYNYKDNYSNRTQKNDDNNSDNSELIPTFNMNDIYEKGYFRPLKVGTPDLVTIKIKSSNALNIQKGLLQVLMSDQLYSNELYFYVDSEFAIHYLSLVSQEPLCFKSLGFPPQLGCSGSPIFMAQVILGKQPKWKFTVVAAIFAKDSSDVLYGIPVMEEFEQIRMILIDTNQTQQSSKLSDCSAKLGDSVQTEKYNDLSKSEQALADRGIKIFKDGHSTLNFSLPKDLIQLRGTTFMKLSTSLLVVYKNLDLQEVMETFHNFISYIKTYQSLVVNGSLELVLTSKCNNWRLDREFSGAKNDFLILHIQDNTGKGKKDPKCTSKSASSIFAQVKIQLHSTIEKGTTISNKVQPVSTEISINCDPLGDDLLRSHEAIETDMKGAKEIVVNLNHRTDIKVQKYKLIECPNCTSDSNKWH